MPILSGLWAKVVGAGAVVLAVLAFVARVFYAGKQSERAANTAKGLQHEQERKQVDVDVATADDAERARLRDKWSARR